MSHKQLLKKTKNKNKKQKQKQKQKKQNGKAQEVEEVEIPDEILSGMIEAMEEDRPPTLPRMQVNLPSLPDLLNLTQYRVIQKAKDRLAIDYSKYKSRHETETPEEPMLDISQFLKCMEMRTPQYFEQHYEDAIQILTQAMEDSRKSKVDEEQSVRYAVRNMRKELIQKTIITETKVILLDLGTGKGQVPNTYQKREDYYKDKDTIVLPQDKDLSLLLDGPLFHFFESIVAPEWKANPERFQYDLNVDLLSLEPETFKIMEEFHVTHVTLFNVVQYIEYKGVLRLIQHCISKGICLVMYGPVHDQYDNEEANVTLTERPIDVTQPQNRGRAKYLIKLTEPDGNVYEEFYYPKALWNKFGLQAGWSGSAMEFWKQFGTGIAYSMKEYRRRHILYFHPVITFDLIRAELKAKDETKVLTSQAKILDYNNLPEIKKSLLTMHRKMDVYPKKNGILVRIYGSYCYDRRGAVYELSSQEKIYGYGELLLDSSQSYILHPLKLNQISNYRVLAPRRTFVKWSKELLKEKNC
jgi:hypothetical protein